MGNTSEIGLFKIVQETSIGANTRRLDAVTSIEAYQYMSRMEEELRETARFLKVPPLDVSERVAKMQTQLDELEGMRKRRMKAVAEGSVTEFMQMASELDGYKLIIADLGEALVQGMREMWDIVKQRGGGEPFAVVLFARNPEGGNPLMLAAGTQGAVDAGFNAKDVIANVASLIGGGGGGKPAMAQAGGKNAEGIPAAIDKAKAIFGV